MTAPAEDPRIGEARPAPTVEDIGYECDWGSCHGEATALRWNESGEGIVAWLPVCARHRTKDSVSYDALRPAVGRGDTDSSGEACDCRLAEQGLHRLGCPNRRHDNVQLRSAAARSAVDRAEPPEGLREAIVTESAPRLPRWLRIGRRA